MSDGQRVCMGLVSVIAGTFGKLGPQLSSRHGARVFILGICGRLVLHATGIYEEKAEERRERTTHRGGNAEEGGEGG